MYIILANMNAVQLNIEISQHSAATDFKLGSRFYFSFSTVQPKTQKWKKTIKTEKNVAKI